LSLPIRLTVSLASVTMISSTVDGACNRRRSLSFPLMGSRPKHDPQSSNKARCDAKRQRGQVRSGCELCFTTCRTNVRGRQRILTAMLRDNLKTRQERQSRAGQLIEVCLSGLPALAYKAPTCSSRSSSGATVKVGNFAIVVGTTASSFCRMTTQDRTSAISASGCRTNSGRRRRPRRHCQRIHFLPTGEPLTASARWISWSRRRRCRSGSRGSAR